MIVIDVETTGLDPRVHGIVSLGAVQLSPGRSGRSFYQECRPHTGALFSEEALQVNGFSREYLDSLPEELDEDELLSRFCDWLEIDRSDRVLASVNPTFDVPFLQAAYQRVQAHWPFGYRYLDVHTAAYLHLTRAGVTVPTTRFGQSALSLNRMLDAFGLPREPAPHHALNGALCAAQVLHRIFGESAQYITQGESWAIHSRPSSTSSSDSPAATAPAAGSSTTSRSASA